MASVWVCRIVIPFAAVLAVTALLLMASAALAQEGSCGRTRVLVEGGDPSPFVLPADRSQTLEVDPEGELIIRLIDPPHNPAIRWSVNGIAGSIRDVSSGEVRVDLADVASHIRGLYEIRGVVLSGSEDVCTVTFNLKIVGFGGTAAVASAAVAGIAGVGGLASVPYTASGVRTKVELKTQVQRRRPRGWRRWIPIPAWKRTIISTLMGAFTGLAVTVLLQQSGYTLLSVATAVRGIIVGGGVTFGVGFAWGALWTYIRPPKESP